LLIYKGLCPNCGGVINEWRLRHGLPCSECIDDTLLQSSQISSKEYVKELLLNSRKLGRYWRILSLEEDLREFDDFFYEVTGKRLWSIQKSWAKRLLSNESFALIAPTGVGKTTLLLTYALYRARNNARILYIVPTRELMNHVYRVLSNMSRNNGLELQLLMSDNIKKDYADLKNGNYIAILTHHFIHRNKSLLSDVRFDVVEVDDFDALLKSSSIVDLVLRCIGISEEAIDYAKKVAALKGEIAFIKYLGDEERVNKLRNELYELSFKLIKLMDYSSIGQLLVASATGRGRGERVKILRELLGFEIGAITDYLRNLVEVHAGLGNVDLKDLLSKLIGGTLIFVSKDLGLSYARYIVNILESSGFRVALANSRRALDRLRNNDVDVLVGVASYYGILTRGIDEPLRIYNTIFVGVPKVELGVDSLILNPRVLTYFASELGRLGLELDGDTINFIRKLRTLSPKKVRLLSYALRGLIEVNEPLLTMKNTAINLIPKVLNFIKNGVEAYGKLVIGDYVIRYRNGRLLAQIPDVMTYIQASGRGSRLYNGRMTLGLSVILVDDYDFFQVFIKRLKNYVVNFEPRHLNDIDINEVKREQILTRGLSDSFTVSSAANNNIRSALLIVESPTKARTIASMFGRPGKRYIGDYVIYETVIPVDNRIYVTSIAPTYGHLTDLVVNEEYHGIKLSARGLLPIYTSIKRCLDCGYQFTDDTQECPRCNSPRLRDSKKVIEILRKVAQEADVIFIATDPDDEGEKIAYDAYLMLRPYVSDIKRVEFHEVTRKALLDAIRNPRDISMQRVDAQVVRRVDDRLVGFELSNILKKYFNKYWLGGGRVQTPVLNWVVDRYRSYVENRGYNIVIKLFDKLFLTLFIKDRDDALELVNKIRQNGVKLVKVKEFQKVLQPKPPYTTDDLLIDASHMLKLPATKVMKLAQELFELGYITYHRTDSTHVSSVGIEVAREFLMKKGVIQLFRPRHWGERGAHECIRPTKPLDSAELHNLIMEKSYTQVSDKHLRLYDLILRRFIASQMPEAVVEFHVFTANIAGYSKDLEIPVNILSSGFLEVLNTLAMVESLRGVNEIVLQPPDVKVLRGSNTKLFTSSDIIRIMKEKSIGRPSTYAKAIDNNIRHGYVILSKKHLYLIPTKLGIDVCNLLVKYFPNLVSEKLTREVEKLVDAVREGLLDRDDALVLLLSDVIDLRLRENNLINSVADAGGTGTDEALEEM